MHATSRVLAALATLMALAATALHAAEPGEWPTRPVRFIVPFPPGGTVDPLARLLGTRLTAALGQQFVIDNRTGGSGSIGTAIAAKSPPDGYTYLFVFDTHAVNPALLRSLPYDTVRDFAPVMLVGTSPNAISVVPSKPFRTFDDVVKAAKSKPGTITYGSVGAGSLGHLSMTLAEKAGGMSLVHVPYKGGAPMVTDVLGGHIDIAVGSVALLAPQVAAGKLRAVAVTGEKRSGAMPDVATLQEQGFPGLYALAWWGIFAPAGSPPAIVKRLHAELVKALNQPDLRKQLSEQLGMDLRVSDPATLQKFLVAEMERWGKVVRENGIRAD